MTKTSMGKLTPQAAAGMVVTTLFAAAASKRRDGTDDYTEGAVAPVWRV